MGLRTLTVIKVELIEYSKDLRFRNIIIDEINTLLLLIGSRRFGILLSVVSVLFSISFMLSGPRAALADSINQGVFAVESNPYGVSYEDWTTRFWQWLVSIPASKNPAADQSGEFCQEGQGTLPVFFLVFSGSGEQIARAVFKQERPYSSPSMSLCVLSRNILVPRLKKTCIHAPEKTNPATLVSTCQSTVENSRR